MIRVYVENIQDTIMLNAKQMHYLKNVMRCQDGQIIEIFDNQNEWRAKISFPHIHAIEQKNIEQKLATIQRRPKIGMGYIRKSRLEWAIEKATELGVDEIYLLMTDRVNHKYIDLRRLERIAIEAAEQCGRIGVPKIHENIKLSNLPELNWVVAAKEESSDKNAKYYESQDNQINNAQIKSQDTQINSQSDSLIQSNLVEIIENNRTHIEQSNSIDFWNGDGILIGPEGGWSENDLSLLQKYNKVQLHDNVLRTETAVCAALTLFRP
ncbi:16S rRNA (uracil(1498)-N(3))-methyltransferase [Candidatus Cytomitobacter primus]|nr:RsmE family RNA methyltransferase [Candidatus Cytomitobacter primus]